MLNSALVQRATEIEFSPSNHGIILSWNEWTDIGITLYQQACDCLLKMGYLALWGWDYFCPDLNRHQWTLKCGDEWGCHHTTVDRAMTRASSPAALPEDKTPTWQYAAVSAGRGDLTVTEALIDTALREGWSAYKIYLASVLYWEGLTGDEWFLPTFALKGDGIVARDGNGREEVFARFEGDSDLTRAAKRLLRQLGKF